MAAKQPVRQGIIGSSTSLSRARVVDSPQPRKKLIGLLRVTVLLAPRPVNLEEAVSDTSGFYANVIARFQPASFRMKYVSESRLAISVLLLAVCADF